MGVKHKVRRKNGKLKEVDLTRSLAIKAFCTECLGWETHPRIVNPANVHCGLLEVKLTLL